MNMLIKCKLFYKLKEYILSNKTLFGQYEKIYVFGSILKKENYFMKRQRKNDRTINIYKILTIVLAVVLIVVLIIFGRSWMVQKNAQKEYEKLSAQVNDLQNQVNDNQINIPSDTQTETENVAQEVQTEDSELEQKGIEIPQKNLNWKKLKGVNQDIYAWIYIPGTGVDYPVLQHPSDDSYYLNYNMNGTRGYPGCIYTEKANSKEFTDFDTVVYGHNMRNDTMFASLHNYEDQTFFNNFPYIYVYTKEKVLVYEIFAAYKTDDAHILHTNDFSTKEGRVSYLESIVKKSKNSPEVKDKIQLSVDSHLLTLSTCVSRQADKRFVVQAILLNEEQL